MNRLLIDSYNIVQKGRSILKSWKPHPNSDLIKSPCHKLTTEGSWKINFLWTLSVGTHVGVILWALPPFTLITNPEVCHQTSLLWWSPNIVPSLP